MDKSQKLFHYRATEPTTDEIENGLATLIKFTTYLSDQHKNGVNIVGQFKRLMDGMIIVGDDEMFQATMDVFKPKEDPMKKFKEFMMNMEKNKKRDSPEIEEEVDSDVEMGDEHGDEYNHMMNLALIQLHEKRGFGGIVNVERKYTMVFEEDD